MIFMEIIIIYPKNTLKAVYTQCGPKAELLFVETDGML
jgi:hypothetical protein